MDIATSNDDTHSTKRAGNTTEVADVEPYCTVVGFQEIIAGCTVGVEGMIRVMDHTGIMDP